MSRPRPISTELWVTTFLLPSLLSSVLSASTIMVDTTQDEIVADSTCSLREAVTAANTNVAFSGCIAGDSGVVDEILLPAGIYTLDLGANGDDANLGGDLDITESVRIVGQGPLFVWWDDPLTADEEVLDVYTTPLDWDAILDAGELPAIIIENGIGLAETRGDGDRILHIDPAGVGGVDVEVVNLALRYGDVGCTTSDCDMGGAAIWSQGDGSITLENVVIDSNVASCTGEECALSFSLSSSFGPIGASAIAASEGGSLSLTSSAITNNTAICEDALCQSAPTVVVKHGPEGSQEMSWDQTLFGRNLNHCDGSECIALPAIFARLSGETVHQSVFWDNELSCADTQCEAQSFFTGDFFNPERRGLVQPQQDWSDVEVSKNRIGCFGGADPKFDPDDQGCKSQELFIYEDSADESFFTRVRLANNTLSCTGYSCDIDELVDTNSAVLTDVDFLDNMLSCEGELCDTDEVFDSFLTTFERVTFLRNVVSCDGDGCEAAEVVQDEELHWVDVTISQNESRCVGTGCKASAVLGLVAGELADIRTSTISQNTSACTGFNCWIGEHCPSGAGFCSRSEGGAISARAIVRMIDSTVDGNSTNASGAGIFVREGSSVQLVGSSVTNNDALFDGGGVFNRGLVSPGGSTLSGNTPMGTDCVDFETGVGCDAIFIDGFDFGDTLSWSSTSP